MKYQSAVYNIKSDALRRGALILTGIVLLLLIIPIIFFHILHAAWRCAVEASEDTFIELREIWIDWRVAWQKNLHGETKP